MEKYVRENNLSDVHCLKISHIGKKEAVFFSSDTNLFALYIVGDSIEIWAAVVRPNASQQFSSMHLGLINASNRFAFSG